MTPDASSHPIIFPYDFYHFWAAGRVAVEGGDPYDRVAVFERMLTVGWPITEGFHGFLHPPWTIWLFGLLGELPFNIAVVVWFLLAGLISLVAFSVCSRWLASTLEPLGDNHSLFSSPLSTKSWFLPFIFFTFPPLLGTFWNGQTNIFILLGFALFILYERKKFDLAAGIALSLALVKPQLFIGFFAALMIFALRSGRLKIIAGIAIGFIAQVCASLVIAPKIFNYFIEAASNMTTSSVTLPGASLAQTIYQLFPFQLVFPLVSIAFTISVAIFALRANIQKWVEHLLLICLPLSLMSSPYIWSHSLLPLIFGYLWIAVHFYKHERIYLYVHIFFVTVGIFEILRPHSLANFMVLIPIGILLIGLSLARRPFPLRPQ